MKTSLKSLCGGGHLPVTRHSSLPWRHHSSLVTRHLSLVTAAAVLAAATAAASPMPAGWRQADFAAELYRHAVATANSGDNVVLSPWGVADCFALLQTSAKGDTARGMAFALQLGGAEPPAPNEVAATFREARTALSRAARADASIEESGTNGTFRLSAKWDSAAAEILDTPLCSALRLPCVGGTFEMLAITPSPSNTLGEVEARLGRAFFDRLASAPRTTSAEPICPRFEIQAQFDLKAVLSPMGMAAFFADNAAGQSVFLAVGDEGIEASVITGVPLPHAKTADSAETARPVKPTPPFLFIIRETRTGLIIFLGRDMKP